MGSVSSGIFSSVSSCIFTGVRSSVRSGICDGFRGCSGSSFDSGEVSRLGSSIMGNLDGTLSSPGNERPISGQLSF